jgi:hypothetical protein
MASCIGQSYIYHLLCLGVNFDSRSAEAIASTDSGMKLLNHVLFSDNDWGYFKAKTKLVSSNIL